VPEATEEVGQMVTGIAFFGLFGLMLLVHRIRGNSTD
jgi:hypothetical protein